MACICAKSLIDSGGLCRPSLETSFNLVNQSLTSRSEWIGIGPATVLNAPLVLSILPRNQFTETNTSSSVLHLLIAAIVESNESSVQPVAFQKIYRITLGGADSEAEEAWQLLVFMPDGDCGGHRTLAH